jgi:hypothetical protein
MLENRSHAVGQSLDKRTLLRVGRGQPVGLYAPLHWRAIIAARPSTARFAVGREIPLPTPTAKPEAKQLYTDALRPCSA